MAARYQDLTHVFRAGSPVYSGDAPVRRTLVTVANDGFYAQQWTFGEHSDTHMDAPGHFVTDRRRASELRPRELFAPAVVIDISVRRRDERMPLECAGDIGLCHIMKLRLTCDHRILCCADARGFLRRIKELLKQPPAMSL